MKVKLLGFFGYKSKKTGKDSTCVYISYKQNNVTGEACAQCFLDNDNFVIDCPEDKIGKEVDAEFGMNSQILSISDI